MAVFKVLLLFGSGLITGVWLMNSPSGWMALLILIVLLVMLIGASLDAKYQWKQR